MQSLKISHTVSENEPTVRVFLPTASLPLIFTVIHMIVHALQESLEENALQYLHFVVLQDQSTAKDLSGLREAFIKRYI